VNKVILEELPKSNEDLRRKSKIYKLPGYNDWMALPSPCSQIFGNGVTTMLSDGELTEAVKYL